MSPNNLPINKENKEMIRAEPVEKRIYNPKVKVVQQYIVDHCEQGLGKWKKRRPLHNTTYAKNTYTKNHEHI